jgi:hypothetical protein
MKDASVRAQRFAYLQVLWSTSLGALLLASVATAQQRDGVKKPPVSVKMVTLQKQLTIEFQEQPQSRTHSSLMVTLEGAMDSPERDTRIAWVRNVVAMDDRGNLLTAVSGHINTDNRPWVANLAMPGPHPEARKLAWLEGNLYGYQKSEPLRVEFSLPLPDNGARQQVGDVLFELTGLTPGAQGQPAEEALRAASRGPTLQGSVRAPQLTRLQGPEHGWVGVTLIGASGKVYASNRASGGGESGGRGVIAGIHHGFPLIDEPLVKARIETLYLHDPGKLFSFRLTDIPIPPERPFRPGRGSGLPAAAGPPTPPVDHPYYDEKGGTLTTQVRIGSASAPVGRLSIGLSRVGPGAAGAVRWWHVDVDREGKARIERLKPGTYRVVRTYAPYEQPAVTGSGRWSSGDVRVEVRAGCDAMLPPLHWEPTPGGE